MRLVTAQLALAGALAACRTADVPTAQSYLDTKAAYTKRASTPGRPWPAINMDSARSDLETRLRALTGPVSFDGTEGVFNADWIFRDGTEGGELDAIRFGKPWADTTILVTNEQVMAAWVRQMGDSAPDPFVGLGNDRVLTWVLNTNAHATIFTDVRKHARLPDDVRLALLITHAQDVVGRSAPQKLVLGIRRGSRSVVVFVRAATLPPPAECVQALDSAIKASGMYFDEEEAVFMGCYDRLAPKQPELKQVVAQVLEWNRIVAAKVP